MSQGHDSYAPFANHYDRHGWDWYMEMYGGRLLQLLEQKELGGGSVLDAGCGTGTLALSLVAEGFDVTGVDLSDELLNAARRKKGADAVTWQQADITRFDLGRTFDVVVCVADVLNHLESIDGWQRSFECFARHLRPGGCLIFDVMTCRGLRRMGSYTIKEKTEETLIVGVVYEENCRRSTVKVTSFVRAEGKSDLYERASVTITEWGQPVSEIYDRLTRAGFETPDRPWRDFEDPEVDERLAVVTSRASR